MSDRPRILRRGRTHPEEYRRGCECPYCESRRAYARAYRKDLYRLAKTNPELVPHGTATGAKNWGCKCERCATARRIYDKESRAARKQRRSPVDTGTQSIFVVSRPISV